MKIERARPARFVIELHAYELAQLMAAARWTLESGGDELPPEVVDGLGQIVASYDEQLARLAADARSTPG